MSFCSLGLRNPLKGLVETAVFPPLTLGALMLSRPFERKQAAMLGIRDTSAPWNLDPYTKVTRSSFSPQFENVSNDLGISTIRQCR